MNRIIKSILTFIVFTVIVAVCINIENMEHSPYNEVNNLDGVWIKVEDNSVSSHGANISIYNAAGRGELIYGTWYCIEKKIGECWYQLDLVPNKVSYPSLDIHIPKYPKTWDNIDSESFSKNAETFNAETDPVDVIQYNWEWLYGSLGYGDYRFIIEVVDVSDAPSIDLPSYYLSAEFSINV